MIWPMFMMVLLTFAVGIVAVRQRIQSVKNKTVSLRYFKLMDGPAPPEAMVQSTRCFNNQFETPVLFYVVCTLSEIVGDPGATGIALAWAYVASRMLHAWIHLTYNNVLHRMYSFWFGLACILGLWIVLVTTTMQ